MKFAFSEEHVSIVEAAERVFADQASDDQIKALSNSDELWHQPLWQQLAETGMLGLAIPEQHGGSGLSLAELCGLAELNGRFVTPIPLLSTLVECAFTLAESSAADLAGQLLPRIASGELIVSPVRPYQGLRDHPVLTAEQHGERWILNGVSAPSPYLAQAGGMLVGVGQGEQTLLAYCEAGTAGVTLTPQQTISNEPCATAHFDNCTVTAVVATGSAAAELLEAQRQRACVGAAAVALGTLEEGLRRTAQYVSERRQFGRPLGAFQAVSQRAADAYMVIEALRSVYWRAIDDIEQGADLALSARVAGYWVGKAAHQAGHTILHLHGGIGQDIDYPVHRFFLLAKQLERYLGSPDESAAQVGDLLAKPGATATAGVAG